MSKKYLLFACGLLFIIFSSCASRPKFEGTANLTGMIVDENNQPVYGFPVSASSGVIVYETVATNENGIFIIQNVHNGKISFSGKKEGYVFLDRDETFYQRDKIICFQVSSADAVLDRVEEKIMQEDYAGGLNGLKQIYAKLGSPLHSVIREYEKYCKNEKKAERQNKSKNKDGENEKV